MDDLVMHYSFRMKNGGGQFLHFNSEGKFLGVGYGKGIENSKDPSSDPEWRHPWIRLLYKVEGHFYINNKWYIDIEWSDLDESTCNLYERMLESMSIVEVCDHINSLHQM